MELSDFLLHLEGVKGPSGSGEYTAICPAHDDIKQSLCISEGDDGRVLLYCQAGCDSEDIVAHMGLTMKDLMPDSKQRGGEEWVPDGGTYVTSYEYPNGQKKIRFINKNGKKDFLWKHKEGNEWKYGQYKKIKCKSKNGKEYTKNDPEDVKQRGHSLYFAGPVDSDKVILVEGEKDADNVRRKLGLHNPEYTAASTGNGGSKSNQRPKWESDYTKQLTGKTVYILNDNDDTGYAHAANAAKQLDGHAAAVYLMDIKDIWPDVKEHGDISDAYETLGDSEVNERLLDAIKSAVEYSAEKPAAAIETAPDAADPDSGVDINGRVFDLGSYSMDDSGVYDAEGKQVCPHMIWISEVLSNEETLVERYRLNWSVLGKEKSWVFDADEIFDTRKIVGLAKYGISVSSGERAKGLVEFLRTFLDCNRVALHTQPVVSGLGWRDDNAFVPYAENVAYDESDRFGELFKAIQPKGDFEKWRSEIAACRSHSVEVKIAIAAAFASVLIRPSCSLPFFVHIWSTKSSIGKTVALYAAASVWGRPDKYCENLSSTTTSQEFRAAFLRDLPMCLDELQLGVDKNGRSTVNVYQLAEGQGKSRSNKNLGLRQGQRWSNCIITTGETPLTNMSDGAGAYNRIIDVMCDEKLFEDCQKTLHVIDYNYGMAGPRFIKALQADAGFEDMLATVDGVRQQLVAKGAADKQACSAALLVAADTLACAAVFDTNDALSVDDILPYLQTESDIDRGERAYSYICDWVYSHPGKFDKGNNMGEYGPTEIYGKIVKCGPTERGYCHVKFIQSCFDKICEEGHFNAASTLQDLRKKDLLVLRADGRAKNNVRIGQKSFGCITVKVPDEQNMDYPEPIAEGDMTDKVGQLFEFPAENGHHYDSKL